MHLFFFFRSENKIKNGGLLLPPSPPSLPLRFPHWPPSPQEAEGCFWFKSQSSRSSIPFMRESTMRWEPFILFDGFPPSWPPCFAPISSWRRAKTTHSPPFKWSPPCRRVRCRLGGPSTRPVAVAPRSSPEMDPLCSLLRLRPRPRFPPAPPLFLLLLRFTLRRPLRREGGACHIAPLCGLARLRPLRPFEPLLPMGRRCLFLLLLLLHSQEEGEKTGGVR